MIRTGVYIAKKYIFLETYYHKGKEPWAFRLQTVGGQTQGEMKAEEVSFLQVWYVDSPSSDSGLVDV